MAIVGYLEGTDPRVLTRLAVQGVGTLPLSNGVDHHGKYVNHLTPQDGVTVVVGYLHKVLPTPGIKISPQDILFACLTHNIPVLLIAEREDHDRAREVLGKAAEHVRLVAPADLYDTILAVIS